MSPIPRPRSTICGTIEVAYGTSMGLAAIHAMDDPNIRSPVVTTARVPSRGASSPPAMEATAMLTATGRIRVPVDRASYPRITWKYWVTRKMKPASEKKVTVTAPLAALNRRSANRLTSSMGCSARRSATTNATRSTAVTANPTIVAVDPQPRVGASMIVHTSRPSIALESTRPRRSSGGAAGSRDSGTKNAARAAATRARGASARNTLPHEKWVSSRPPTTGPVATPTPTTAPQPPSAAARCRRSGKALEITDSVAGKISAAKAPMTTRAAISAPSELTSPPTVVATAKPTRPMSSAGRRPYRSERLPAARTRAANARL